MLRASPPLPLVTGAVRAWHIVVLDFLFFIAMAVVAAKLTIGQIRPIASR